MNISTKEWEDLFDNLQNEIEINKDSFTSSTIELASMAVIYQSIITQNISKMYFDSIISNQKNAFNYTIMYYYNFLLRITNSTYNYLLNRILVEQTNYNYIIDSKKNIVNDFFTGLIKNISLKMEESLKIVNQLNALGVSETNFFQFNNLLNEHINYISNSLTTKYINIIMNGNQIQSDKFSVIAKMYLEDIESAKQIISLYSPTNDDTFIKLDEQTKNFEQIIINNNWVFNFDEFTHELKVQFYNLNKEINEKILRNKEIYKKKLENILNEYFTKEGIIEKTIELYNKGINKIDSILKK